MNMENRDGGKKPGTMSRRALIGGAAAVAALGPAEALAGVFSGKEDMPSADEFVRKLGESAHPGEVVREAYQVYIGNPEEDIRNMVREISSFLKKPDSDISKVRKLVIETELARSTVLITDEPDVTGRVRPSRKLLLTYLSQGPTAVVFPARKAEFARLYAVVQEESRKLVELRKKYREIRTSLGIR